jgi:hypothetical protein
MSPIAWILLFIILLSSVSYLYVHHKNWGKVAIGSLFILTLIGGWSFGQKIAKNEAPAAISMN